MKLAVVVVVGSAVLTSLVVTNAAAQSATTMFDRPTAAAVDPAPRPSTSSSPTPSSSSAPPPGGSSSSSSPQSGSSSFPPLTQDKANGLFDGFLTHGFQSATDGMRQGLQRLVADTNLVTNTSATWTYQQPTVVALQRAVQMASNAALGLLIFWMGLNVVLRSQLGGSYTDVHELIPRVVLGAGLANSAAHWTALAIDLNNAACANFLVVNSGSLSDLFPGFPIFDHTWLLAVLLVAFLLVWLWLFIKMAARMAMLMVLLVLAPAAQMCWALPQTRGLADRWHRKFWSTLYAQVVVTVTLKLAWGFAGSAGSNPIALLITICLLFLAANSPELLAGGAARLGLSSLVETGFLIARATGGAPAAAAAAGGASAAAARGAGASTPSVAAASVPLVMASPIAVSGQTSGTGDGSAAETKSPGFGRGGRTAASAGTESGAATDKGRGQGQQGRAAS
jgi:hypothetical protein